MIASLLFGFFLVLILWIIALFIDKDWRKRHSLVERFCLDRSNNLAECYRFAKHNGYSEENAVNLINKYKIIREESIK